MKAWNYAVLFLAGLGVFLLAARFESAPGYMDAEYYWVTGQQLVRGKGFSEPFIWNYLTSPAGIPSPSHLYWMPLASFAAALGMWLAGQTNFQAAQMGMVVLAAFIPPLTAYLCFTLGKNRLAAWVSGGLAIFSGFYIPRLVTTDTFALVMALGAAAVLLLGWMKRSEGKLGRRIIAAVLAGGIAGLMHLARADGLLWIGFLWLGVMLIEAQAGISSRPARLERMILGTLAVLAGYGLVMGPWMARTYRVAGSLFSPGGSASLWLTNYNELFRFDPAGLTPAHWWSSGLGAILNARWEAFTWNLGSSLAIQMEILLLPFVLLGLWKYRRDVRIQVGGIAWILLLGLMTVVFPFSGSRGGWFHSGAALQPLIWTLAALGLAEGIDWMGRHKGWQPKRAYPVFSAFLLLFCGLISLVAYQRVVIGADAAHPLWSASFRQAAQVGEALRASGAAPDTVIMVNDPPGFFGATGFPAIVIPAGNEQALLAAAQKYQAGFLALDENIVPQLQDLFANPHDRPHLAYVSTQAGMVIYRFEDLR